MGLSHEQWRELARADLEEGEGGLRGSIEGDAARFYLHKSTKEAEAELGQQYDKFEEKPLCRMSLQVRTQYSLITVALKPVMMVMMMMIRLCLSESKRSAAVDTDDQGVHIRDMIMMVMMVIIITTIMTSLRSYCVGCLYVRTWDLLMTNSFDTYDDDDDDDDFDGDEGARVRERENDDDDD